MTMLKKLVLLLAALVVSISTALAAAVDVNTADQATLESLKGIGPVKSQAIIAERNKNGPFKDADDLANRVKGIGAKTVTKLEAEGMTIGGGSAPPKAMSGAQRNAPAKTVKPSATAAGPSSAPTTAMPASSAQEIKGTAKSKKKKGKAKAASAASGA
jgi:competence protein ComEA